MTAPMVMRMPQRPPKPSKIVYQQLHQPASFRIVITIHAPNILEWWYSILMAKTRPQNGQVVMQKTL